MEEELLEDEAAQVINKYMTESGSGQDTRREGQSLSKRSLTGKPGLKPEGQRREPILGGRADSGWEDPEEVY